MNGILSKIHDNANAIAKNKIGFLNPARHSNNCIGIKFKASTFDFKLIFMGLQLLSIKQETNNSIAK